MFITVGEELGVKKPLWMDLKKMFTQLLPDWTKEVSFKTIARKNAGDTYWATLKANKAKGGKPHFKFRCRKDPVVPLWLYP